MWHASEQTLKNSTSASLRKRNHLFMMPSGEESSRKMAPLSQSLFPNPYYNCFLLKSYARESTNQMTTTCGHIPSLGDILTLLPNRDDEKYFSFWVVFLIICPNRCICFSGTKRMQTTSFRRALYLRFSPDFLKNCQPFIFATWRRSAQV
ncbi:hypothetical protein BS47DRAFT_883115 [Hydnum rufescens UP504]|uniref:Uncharacterized protein n=1 Tax=Hydnum rufescens UP504 TaxID=1448309 RepID=A0A9P6B0U0_9AGAM|nr:hypothetical protein BS47DRAFT_883115 [Hydnum rufescens UP504]